jgi:hypothetical protein
MRKRFDGGYYFAILELFEELNKKDKRAYHGRELFEEFEEMFGSGNRINFNKSLRQLVKSGKLNKKKGKNFNQVFYSLKVKYKNTIQ